MSSWWRHPLPPRVRAGLLAFRVGDAVNAGRASKGARYHPSRKRRISTAMLTLLAAAIAVTLMLALGARAVVARNACASSPLVVRVAAAAEIVPVVSHVGELFNRQRHQIAGHCEQIVVQAAPPAVTARELAQPGRHLPPADAWIPDSALWVDLARGTPAGAARVQPTTTVIAHTPLVIVMSRQDAARTPAFGTSVSWRYLFPQNLGGPAAALGLNVQFPDPAQSAAGLASLIEIRRLLGYGRPGRFNLARFAFNVQVVPPASGGAGLPSLAALAHPASPGNTSVPVTVTSEQAVAQFDQAHPDQPLAVRYPAEGTYELSYPYTVTSTSRLTAAAAKTFGLALRSAYASAYARYEDFRTAITAPVRWPASFGLDFTQPSMLAEPGPSRAQVALNAWQRLLLGLRMLAVNDVSAAMGAAPVPGGPTLEQMLGHAAALGLAHFPDSTQMGLWVFASNLQGTQPYLSRVPIGPLPAPFGLISRRQAIANLAASGKSLPHVGAALYRTVLAAYQQMVASYQPRYVNTIVVLTAGVDSAPGDISPATLLADLTKLYNRRQPVNITLIMIGQAGNFTVLRQIAAATNGKAYDITSPGQIRTVFYHAMGRLICQPHCRA
jgi:hypothetical protein